MPKLLLDENLPRKLEFRFGEGYEVITASEMGWNSLKDDELLDTMNLEKVDYLVTVDKNLMYQQKTEKWTGKLVVLDAFDNRYETLLPLIATIKQELAGAYKSVYWISG